MKVKLRRHTPLVLALVVVIALAVVLLGDTRISAYTVPGDEAPDEAIINIDNGVDLLDDTVVHEIVVLISEEDQAEMVRVYQETGEKDYYPADVIIDGVRINNVGIRLKGNASLATATGMRQGMGAGAGVPAGRDGELPDGFRPPGEIQPRGEGFQPPEGRPRPDGQGPPAGFEPPDGFEPPAGMERPGVMPAPGAGPQFNLGSEPSGLLPYLIKVDEYEPGQRYQGLSEIALRTSGTTADPSLLQEPISNYVMNSVGVPAVRTAFASVQLTGGEPQLYTIAEQLDQTYLDRILDGSDGVLYKVTQVGNDFGYLGEDPTLYDGIFDQKTAVNEADLAPLIDLIRFVNQASDAEFVEKLPEHLDVVAFADYLAVHNLLVNNDSLAGMGNNYYLYYDFESGRFTILSWDANESLGGMRMGPDTEMDIYWEAVGDMFGRGFGGPGRGMDRHLLKGRFMAALEYRELYKERYAVLYEAIYGEDVMGRKIAEYAGLVTEYNAEHGIVDQEAYDAAVTEVLEFIAQRHDYLRATELLAP